MDKILYRALIEAFAKMTDGELAEKLRRASHLQSKLGSARYDEYLLIRDEIENRHLLRDRRANRIATIREMREYLKQTRQLPSSKMLEAQGLLKCGLVTAPQCKRGIKNALQKEKSIQKNDQILTGLLRKEMASQSLLESSSHRKFEDKPNRKSRRKEIELGDLKDYLMEKLRNKALGKGEIIDLCRKALDNYAVKGKPDYTPQKLANVIAQQRSKEGFQKSLSNLRR